MAKYPNLQVYEPEPVKDYPRGEEYTREFKGRTDMSGHEQSLANARLGSEWLRQYFLDGIRSIVEDKIIDAGNVARSVTEINDTVKDQVRCLCAEFDRLEAFYRSETDRPSPAFEIPQDEAVDLKERPVYLKEARPPKVKPIPAKPVNPKKGKK